MSQLRWSLLILGVAFIAALAWWEWRRPRQGRAGGDGLRLTPRGPAADAPLPRGPREPAADVAAARVPREPPLELPEIHVRGSLAAGELPVLELASDQEDVPVLSGAQSAPIPADADPPLDELPIDLVPELPADVTADVTAGATAEAEAAGDFAGQTATAETAASLPRDPPRGESPVIDFGEAAVPAPRELPRERLPELPPAPAPRVEWPPDAQRRVVALRLVAMQPTRFAGRSLRQALAAEGFVLGRFAIFHKPDEEQRAVLSAASLTRPGTFDPQTMDSQHYGGLSLFAVVPGPRPLPETFEELVATARSLNERLQGVLQDEAGSPLTPQRIASLREHLGAEIPA
jgi:cell division protein ZipA